MRFLRLLRICFHLSKRSPAFVKTFRPYSARCLTKKLLIDYDQILAATNNLVDEEKLEEIAKLIDNSKRVYFYGIGSSCKP